MINGVCIDRHEGTPQGGPLSPLLANILLDDLDKELESRGHCFCRYADDCNIYVRSAVAGKRVMASITSFLQQRLRLKVNQEKSAVAYVGKRKFLGYRLIKGGILTIAPESLKRAKEKIRDITKRNRSMSLDERIQKLNEFLTGWVTYFRLAQCKYLLIELDKWVRRKLRCVTLKLCKRPFRTATFLRKLGVSEFQAWILALSGVGWWRKSGTPQAQQAMSLTYFREKGLVSLGERYLLVKTVGNRRGTE